jgi:predicted nucleic acid-binding protein
MLPVEVKTEATRRQPLANELLNAISNGKIVETSSRQLTFNTIQSAHRNLGKGELDAISIVTDCLDKSYKPYMILSDDNQARKYGVRHGIKFVGILPLISIGNNLRLITKVRALQYLTRLKKNNFCPTLINERAFRYSLT